jgi:hypothetical protein
MAWIILFLWRKPLLSYSDCGYCWSVYIALYPSYYHCTPTPNRCCYDLVGDFPASQFSGAKLFHATYESTATQWVMLEGISFQSGAWGGTDSGAPEVCRAPRPAFHHLSRHAMASCALESTQRTQHQSDSVFSSRAALQVPLAVLSTEGEAYWIGHSPPRLPITGILCRAKTALKVVYGRTVHCLNND